MNSLRACSNGAHPYGVCDVQLTTKEPETFTDLQADSAALSALGVAHGDMVYLLYHFERSVQPAYRRSDFEKRPFGAHLLTPWEGCCLSARCHTSKDSLVTAPHLACRP